VNRFEVKFSNEAANFLANIDDNAREKVIYNIRKVQVLNDSRLFKKLTNEIWEFRTLYNKKYYRLFAFWGSSSKKDSIVIVAHGIVKKTSKIPSKELKKTILIKRQYLNK